jgi:hypothetical protein
MVPLRDTASEMKAMVSMLTTPNTIRIATPASGPMRATAMGKARMETPTVSVRVKA